MYRVLCYCRQWVWWTALALISATLAACGVPANTVTGPTCADVMQEQPSFGSTAPPHCTDQRLQDDLQEAMTWYREQAAQMRDTLAYPATMSHELGSYYTGPLLHEARESIYYNQRAGRVVFGLWEKIEEIDGPQWSHDGQYATFIMAVRGYEFMILPPPPPERPAGAPPPPRHPVQQWQITMVYDVKDGRWKIWQAHILPQF